MFLGYIHYFRALAILFIVAGHSIDALVWNDNPLTGDLLRIYISNGSTLFVFIAGYLFQHLGHKFSAGRYYRAKLKNVILPYLLVSIPAIVVFTVFTEREIVPAGLYDQPVWMQVLMFYATGRHLTPLWFVPMITLFYLVGPLLIRADRDTRIYYGLPVFMLISCLNARGLPYESFVHFFSVYLLGMWASHYKERLNPLISGLPFLLVAAVLINAFAVSELVFMESTMTWLNYLQKTTLSLFFLGLFYRFNEHLDSPFVSYVADVSFGVFFIHSYFLTANKMAYTHLTGTLPEGNLFIYVPVALVTLFACVLMIHIIKKLTGRHSRMLVGS
ncbi:MAG: acyltransferase family protein [Gammaproteobacteria bacterium]